MKDSIVLKINRQPLLSIDHILNFSQKRPVGDAEIKRYVLKTAAYNMEFSLLPEFSPDSGTLLAYNVNKVVERMISDGNGDLSFIVTKANGSLIHIMGEIQKYKKTNYKNYVPSKNFLEVMGEISLEIPTKLLDREFAAYFEFNGQVKSADGVPVLWALVSTVGVPGKRDLSIITYNKDNTMSQTLTRLTGEKISDTFKFIGVFSIDLFTRTLLNMVTYITGPNEEYVEQFNKFSHNKNIKHIEQQTYTSRGFISLGDGIERLRVQSVGETTVKAFPRWQRCGAGRLEVRLVFVREHTRTYKKLTVESDLPQQEPLVKARNSFDSYNEPNTYGTNFSIKG